MNFFKLKEIIDRHEVTDFGVLDIEEVPDFEIKLENIPEELSYLKRKERRHPKLLYPQAQSVIVFMFQYWDSSTKYDEIIRNIDDPYRYILTKYPKAKNILSIKKTNIKIARYTLVEEYHKKIGEELKKIMLELKEFDKDIDGKIFVDTTPIWEKILAKLSGIGFIGKNTLLISPKFGSYVFLGGLILNKKIKDKITREEIKDGCQNCDRCINACPTKALTTKGLDFLKCISFWTTHTKKDIPNEIKEKTPYLFGCDICQEVCPYNKESKKGKTIFNNLSPH